MYEINNLQTYMSTEVCFSNLETTCTLFLDFELMKLKRGTLLWLTCNLENRTQKVNTNNMYSEAKLISAGASQNCIFNFSTKFLDMSRFLIMLKFLDMSKVM